MEMIILVLLSVFAYMAIGLKFANFNRELYLEKVSNLSFNPGTGFILGENLFFLVLFPVTFFRAVTQKTQDKAIAGSENRETYLCLMTIFFPIKLAWNAVVITSCLVIILCASVVYSALTIFSDKQISAGKSKEASA